MKLYARLIALQEGQALRVPWISKSYPPDRAMASEIGSEHPYRPTLIATLWENNFEYVTWSGQ